MGLCPKPRPPAFLSEKSGAKELNFSCFTLSFRAGIYGTKTGMVSRKKNLLFSACSSAKVGAAHCRRTFFARTKKVPKKYAEGLRALSTPGDAVKFLRFDGDTANFAVWRKRKKHILFLCLSGMGLTQAVFLRYFWNFIIMGFGLPPEFSCWNGIVKKCAVEKCPKYDQH